MNNRNHVPILKVAAGSAFLATILLLAVTVIRSGYYFEFDVDELYHANTVYLIARGSEPFRDFFLPYSPLFHWFLLPLYTVFGFSMETIQWTRVLMILLFCLRIIGAMALVRTLFGKLAAILFLPLFLLDPLTQYASMQIRPDNFMLTVYIAGLLLLSFGFIHNKKLPVFFSGILLGLALLISIKILPGVGAVFVVLLGYGFKRKSAGIPELIYGFSVPLAVFGLYFAARGIFIPMMTNMIIDARAINETLKYPVPLGNFYWPSPATYYGLSFKPALFRYLWSLPLLAFAGAYSTFLAIDLSFPKSSRKNVLRMLLAVSLAVQWLSLFFVRSVFIQYYLPVTWLFAMFAAVALAKFLHTVERHKVFFGITLLVLGTAYVYYLIPGLRANIERARITGTEQKAAIRAIWKHIPETSAVYPGVLFRPLAYPIPYGFTFYDLPEDIFDRYAPIQTYLERNNVPYLNTGDKPWALPDESVRQYVTARYVRDEANTLFWKRK